MKNVLPRRSFLQAAGLAARAPGFSPAAAHTPTQDIWSLAR
jgi:hypothetical protein